jgi:hypothetical protein
MKTPINLSEEEWEKIQEENPELAKSEKKKPPKMNLMIGGKSGSTKIKYGEEYTSLAGRDWKKVLAFGAMEGGLIILAVLGISIGLFLIIMGTFHIKAWEAVVGGVSVCLGIVSGVVATQLHDRI